MDNNEASDNGNHQVKLIGICDPSYRAHRFILLLFIISLSFGTYFCYDIPAALQDVFIQQLDMSFTQFTMLYSFYSIPNILFGFIGGVLIDRVFGIRIGTIIFSSIVTTGQLIFAIGAFTNQLWIIYLGRFIFGIGGGITAISGSTFAAKWFKSKELNLVFGLQLCLARMASTICLNLLFPINNMIRNFLDPDSSANQVIGFTLIIALLTCVYSLLCAIILAYFDYRGDRLLKRQKV